MKTASAFYEIINISIYHFNYVKFFLKIYEQSKNKRFPNDIFTHWILNYTVLMPRYSHCNIFWKTYHLFFWFSSTTAILCLVASYTSSLACILNLFVSEPTTSSWLLFCWMQSNDPNESVSVIENINFCPPLADSDGNDKYWNEKMKRK